MCAEAVMRGSRSHDSSPEWCNLETTYTEVDRKSARGAAASGREELRA
jgi:hypothetical protein